MTSMILGAQSVPVWPRGTPSSWFLVFLTPYHHSLRAFLFVCLGKVGGDAQELLVEQARFLFRVTGFRLGRMLLVLQMVAIRKSGRYLFLLITCHTLLRAARFLLMMVGK